MKELSVSLVVSSPSLSLAELSQKLGRPHSSGSHSKGDTNVGRGAAGPSWTETIWRFDSDEPKTTSIEEHLTNLKAQFSPKELQLLLPLDCKLTIDIVVFFDTVNVSNQIPRSCFPIIDAYKAAIEITCYPTDFKRNE